MKRDRQLARAEVGAEVAADLPDGVDDVLAHLLREPLKLVLVEGLEVRGAVHAVEQALGGSPFCVGSDQAFRRYMKSVISSRSRRRRQRGAPTSSAPRARACDSPASSRASLEAEDAHVRALAEPLVRAARLARLLLRAGHVEDVVHDLEQHAELAGEAAQRRWARSGAPSSSGATATLARDQPPGLELVHVPQAVRIELRRAGDVDVLAADHAADADRLARAREARRATRRGSPCWRSSTRL